MSIKQAYQLGPVELTAYANGELLLPAHIRQLAINTNALCQAFIPVAAQPANWPDLATVGARANDSKANFYDYCKSNWLVAGPEWRQFHQPVRIMYPPGYTQLTVELALAVHTDAVLDVQIGCNGQRGRTPDGFPDRGGGTLQGPDTAHTMLTFSLVVDPGGSDTLTFWHKVKQKGSAYSGAVGIVGDLLGTSVVNDTEECFTDSYAIDVVNMDSINASTFMNPNNATNRGNNAKDCGALVEIYDNNGAVVMPVKQVIDMTGERNLTLGNFGEYEYQKLPDQVSIEMYRTAIWSNLGWCAKVSV